MTDRPADKDDEQQVNEDDRTVSDAQKVDEAEPVVSAETASGEAPVDAPVDEDAAHVHIPGIR